VQFMRERSKLSREERIELTKARREKREGRGSYPGSTDEGLLVERARRGLGPGGEVVQELKDVIWKVGERRRKMAEQLLSSTGTTSASLLEEAVPRRMGSPFTRLDS
jgi:hypothetical protein